MTNFIFYILKFAKELPVYKMQSIFLYLKACKNLFFSTLGKIKCGGWAFRGFKLSQFSNFTSAFIIWREPNVCFSHSLLISKFQFLPKVPSLADRIAQRSAQTSLLDSCPPRGHSVWCPTFHSGCIC